MTCCYGLCVCLSVCLCSCRNVGGDRERVGGGYCAAFFCVVLLRLSPFACASGVSVWVAGVSVLFVCPPPSLRPSPLRGGLFCLWLLRLKVYCEVVVVADVKGRGRPTVEESQRKRRELNARQRAYVVWVATPPAEREIQTLVELCEVLGVTKQAVWKWSKDARVQEAVRFYTLQNASSPDRVQAMLNMVYDVAMEKRDVKYAEVWMRASGVMGQFGRSSDLLDVADEIVEDSIADLSLEELQRVRDLAVAERAEAAAIELAKRRVG